MRRTAPRRAPAGVDPAAAAAAAAAQSAISRQKNLEKAKAAAKGSQLQANAAALEIMCAICRQQFMKTSSRPQLELHAANKHSKVTFAACFPMLPATAP